MNLQIPFISDLWLKGTVFNKTFVGRTLYISDSSQHQLEFISLVTSEGQAFIVPFNQVSDVVKLTFVSSHEFKTLKHSIPGVHSTSLVSSLAQIQFNTLLS